MIAVIHAHPYPHRSRACAALVDAIRDVPGIDLRSIYDLYPDFDIDPAAERAALEKARLVVWLHPLYWYTVPALMKHWLDVVLTGGWAHGEGGDRLRGKDCLWATTAGDTHAYSVTGPHAYAFEAFVPAMEQTARYCGMNWLPPFVVHGADEIADVELREAGRGLRARIDEWAASVKEAPDA